MNGTVGFEVQEKKPKSDSWFGSKECSVHISGDKELLDFLVECIKKKIDCDDDIRVV